MKMQLFGECHDWELSPKGGHFHLSTPIKHLMFWDNVHQVLSHLVCFTLGRDHLESKIHSYFRKKT